jgi:hypothetical protein
MPDLDQIKQAEQGVRDRRGRFARGRSGNPAGRRPDQCIILKEKCRCRPAAGAAGLNILHPYWLRLAASRAPTVMAD